jgi:hypothetical protein
MITMELGRSYQATYKLVIDGDKNTGVELFNLRNDS